MKRVTLGLDPYGGKVIHVAESRTLGDLPRVLAPLGPTFGLFLASDASSLTPDELSAAARSALECGATYVCTWGPACERLHDVFDDEYVAMSIQRLEISPLITTWHDAESLDEALWFFVDVAAPMQESVTDWIAVAISNPAWFDQMLRRLTDLPGLRSGVVEEAPPPAPPHCDGEE